MISIFHIIFRVGVLRGYIIRGLEGRAIYIHTVVSLLVLGLTASGVWRAGIKTCRNRIRIIMELSTQCQSWSRFEGKRVPQIWKGWSSCITLLKIKSHNSSRTIRSPRTKSVTFLNSWYASTMSNVSSHLLRGTLPFIPSLG